jgi:hypothetical protein
LVLGSIVLTLAARPGSGYGVSLQAGRVLFGVSGQTIGDSLTMCGNTVVVDGGWHHMRERAADSQMWLFIDGQRFPINGPDGDISYPDTLTTTPATFPGSRRLAS